MEKGRFFPDSANRHALEEKRGRQRPISVKLREGEWQLTNIYEPFHPLLI